MNKGARIEAYVASLGLETQQYDPCYLAYFGCFNTREYYEAHDVLEHLWLKGDQKTYAFYKGLIQLAGAFVHLRKQRERPDHPKDGRRMHPAVRLFALASANLAPSGPVYDGLSIPAVLRLIDDHVDAIQRTDYRVNPWSPDSAPSLQLNPGAKTRE